MIDSSAIRPHMPVVCSEGGQFAVVDHLAGSSAIKLTRDHSGQPHYIPLDWVTSVDDKVHVDRPGKQAMREWTTREPGASSGQDEASGNPLGAERVRSQQEEGVRSQQEGIEHPERDPERAEFMRRRH